MGYPDDFKADAFHAIYGDPTAADDRAEAMQELRALAVTTLADIYADYKDAFEPFDFDAFEHFSDYIECAKVHDEAMAKAKAPRYSDTYALQALRKISREIQAVVAKKMADGDSQTAKKLVSAVGYISFAQHELKKVLEAGNE